MDTSQKYSSSPVTLPTAAIDGSEMIKVSWHQEVHRPGIERDPFQGQERGRMLF